MRLILELALTHIAGRGRQTIVAILGVALGVGFSIAMAALMQGTEKDFIAQLVDTMPHVQITDEYRTPRRQPAEDLFPAAQFEGLRPKEDRRGILNPAAATASLRAWVPGRLAQSLRTQGVVRYAGRDVGVTVIGIDPDIEAQVSSVSEDFIEGSFDALRAGGNNIIVGDRLAQRLGASTGTTIQVVAPTGQSRGFRIVGQFHTGTNARDEGETYVLLKNAQILSERPNAINDIRLRLEDPEAAPRVARQAEAELGYKAVPWQEANESLLEALVVRNVVMYTVVGAILLVAGFGIFNIISTITHEKARDIAILKSLGFTQGNMRRLFLIEGLALGFAGSAVGWLIGFLLCFALSQVEFKLSGAGVGREMTRLPLFWSPWHYVIASPFALISAGVAGYLPARQAARLNPVDIIRGAT
jgi:lipoprotein-releasing system permease protein